MTADSAAAAQDGEKGVEVEQQQQKMASIARKPEVRNKGGGEGGREREGNMIFSNLSPCRGTHPHIHAAS